AKRTALNSGQLRAVPPTQLRSPSTTDHITIARQRYLEKNKMFDPCTATADIFISLTSTKSLKKLKAYKSADSYLIFRSGWVHNAVVWKVKTKNVHNQSKDECHLIASYQLASYLLLATSYLLLASSL